jgi:hypothetical protein
MIGISGLGLIAQCPLWRAHDDTSIVETHEDTLRDLTLTSHTMGSSP